VSFPEPLAVRQATLQATPVRRGLAARIGLWIVQVALAEMFLMAGGSKLAGAPQMVALFDAIGVGQWFRYVTGGIEVSSVLALLWPRTGAAGGGARRDDDRCSRNSPLRHRRLTGDADVPAARLCRGRLGSSRPAAPRGALPLTSASWLRMPGLLPQWRYGEIRRPRYPTTMPCRDATGRAG